MRVALALALSAASAAVVAAGSPAAAGTSHETGDGPCAASYSLSQVADLGGAAGFAVDISESGWIAGTARPSMTFRPQLPVRQRGSDAVALDVLDGATFARAMGVNNRGTAVGEAFTAAPEASRAVRWASDGSIEVLPGLEGPGGVANGINNRGDVVGASGGRAVVWPATGRHKGGVRPLPHHTERPDAVSRATDVDENGVVVGTSSVYDVHDDHEHRLQRAMLWQGDQVEHLGALADDRISAALAVRGDHIVGEAYDEDNVARAVSFRAGDAHQLPALGTWTHSRANDVNAGGVAVGHESRFAGNTSFGGSAVVWCDGVAVALEDVVHDLPDGWTLQNAAAINDRGQIVGSGSDGNQTVAFALTPSDPN